MYKIAYDIIKNSTLFSFPVLRNIRNYIYSKHLNTTKIYVDQFVRIQQLHKNNESSYEIGEEMKIGAFSLIDLSGNVKIGSRVTISDGVKIFTHYHPIDGEVNWRQNPVEFTDIEIGDDVWIGANAIIIESVKKIGTGAIIGAGTTVKNDIPAMSVVAGVPAHVVRMRKITVS